VGGEPLLLPYLDELILRLKRRNVIPVIFTNGTNIDRKRAAFFFDNGCSVLLKLDSLRREVQDKLTRVEGSYDVILQALSALRDFPFNSDRTNLRLGISTVITRHNYDEIIDIWRLCRTEELFPHIEPVGFEGRAKAHFKELMVSNAQARSLYDRLLEEDETQYGFTWNRFSAMPAIDCKQLLHSVFVSSKGAVQICNGITFSLGNLNEMSLEQILTSPTLRKTRNIMRFIRRPTGIEIGDCYGCRARAYNLLLDMYAEDPIWQPCPE
jgi:MoaA/NifB/PqqE/SkfB family radical SAM enzyme